MMNVQCKAMTGLLAAGIVVGAPTEAPAANQAALPGPVTYSTAGLFTPVAQSAPLNIPVPPFRWPRPPFPALTVSVTQGKGPAQPNPPQCDSLLVTVSGSQFPSGLYSGELDFYNSSDQLVDYSYYTWDSTGPATQTLGTLMASWLAPAATGVTDLHVNVAQDPGVTRNFSVDCTG
jgi:hypothetical protein